MGYVIPLKYTLERVRMGLGVWLVADHLPSKCKALVSDLGPGGKRKRKEIERGKFHVMLCCFHPIFLNSL